MEQGRWKLPWPALGSLLVQRSPTAQQDWVLQWLQPTVWSGAQLEILSCLPTPWSLDLSQAVLETAQEFLAATRNPQKKSRSQADWSVAYPLRKMAYFLHPDVIKTGTDTLESTYPQLQTQDFEPLWKVLRFRQQMRGAIVLPEN